MAKPTLPLFRDALLERSKALRGSTFFFSGGSASGLALRVFSEAGSPLRPVYLQFRNFDWLERELAISDAKSCGFQLEIVDFDEVAFAAAQKDWKELSLGARSERLWNEVTGLRDFAGRQLVSGHGFVRLERAALAGGFNRTHNDSPSKELTPFFDRLCTSAFEADTSMRKFFDLSQEIPFDNSRYWQDFAFKKIFPGFRERPEWRWPSALWWSP